MIYNKFKWIKIVLLQGFGLSLLYTYILIFSCAKAMSLFCVNCLCKVNFWFDDRKPFSRISRISSSVQIAFGVIFSPMRLAFQVVSFSEFPTISPKVCICLVPAILISQSIPHLEVVSQLNLRLLVPPWCKRRGVYKSMKTYVRKIS